MYYQPGTSCGNIINKLDELGIKKRGKRWAHPRIRDILINPVYVRADLDVYNFFVNNGAVAEMP